MSHASEDKARFVTAFSTQLRNLGIDVWLDRWEMMPGDSLVDKIFEEGLKNADAVIVILSHNSVSKPWVREELNHAVVKKIAGHAKLIPVIIDDCAVPECLASVVWEKIENLSEYSEHLQRIARVLFAQNERPPLGLAPEYVGMEGVWIGRLQRIDSVVLKSLCEAFIEKEQHWLGGSDLINVAKLLRIPESEFEEVLQVLEGHGYLTLKRTASSDVYCAHVSIFGMEEFLKHCWSDYDTVIRQFALAIVNRSIIGGRSLVTDLNIPEAVIDHLARTFEIRGWIDLLRWQGGTPACFKIVRVSAELKRWLRETDSK